MTFRFIIERTDKPMNGWRISPSGSDCMHEDAVIAFTFTQTDAVRVMDALNLIEEAKLVEEEIRNKLR